jgi:hypothetical protein
MRNKKEFWENIIIVGSCWLWTGTVFVQTGYGEWYNGRFVSTAHSEAFYRYYGYRPDKRHEHHHLCVTRLCINPLHLVLRTRLFHEDSAPSVQRNKTHCPQGHEYTKENTVLERTANGNSRKCRICRDRRNRNQLRSFA